LNNKRVHEVAKDFKISSDALLKVLRDLGFHHKGYMSYVTDKEIEAIREYFERGKAVLKEGYERKKVKKEEAQAGQKERGFPQAETGREEDRGEGEADPHPDRASS